MAGTAMLSSGMTQLAASMYEPYDEKDISGFAKRLKPLGRILEMDNYYVWGTSPIVAMDGKIHVFFSRWDAQKGMGGWINSSEIAHAVADKHEGRFYMLARDMGRFDHEVGIILESEDGIHWSEPKIGYFGYSHYLEQPSAPAHLKKYGRFERPQILMQNGKPSHLFVATQGGKSMTSSAFVFEVKPNGFG